MATRVETCGTCGTQTYITECDNCGNVIGPEGSAVSGRVLGEDGAFLPLELCGTCSGIPLTLTNVVSTP